MPVPPPATLAPCTVRGLVLDGPPAAWCPPWCAAHDVNPESDGSTLHVHHGIPAEVAGYRVQLRQGVYVEADGSRAEPGGVEVVLGGDAVTLDEARQLVAALALAAATGAG